MKVIKTVLALCLFVYANIAFAYSAHIIGARVSANSDRTRLVFEFTKPVKYKFFHLKHPARLVIDLNNTQLSYNLKLHAAKESLIKNIRYAGYNKNSLRIVLDLNESTDCNIFQLKKFKNTPDRLVVDLKSLDITLFKAVYKKPAIMSLRTAVPVITASSPIKTHDIVIVIDPGHGGADPGATGFHGTLEKNVVLAIAQDLQQELNKQYGFKAELTRNGDYFIPLRGRLRILRRDRGDMFIAIHADAYKDDTARGASVFALSRHGATSEAAHWLASKENESELGHVLTDKSHMLRTVLIDLAQTASISTSLSVGDDIIHNLAQVAKLHHGFVEQAAFVVLKEPDVPSLLVETGFLSNPYEELKLRDTEYQKRVAHAVMLGIKQYYTQRPPPGTYLAVGRHRHA